MAINRRGEPERQRRLPSHVDLGRLAVTIDDLDALVQLLGASSSDPAKVKIEFDDGSVDSAKDIRELSDLELKSLSITTDKIKVRLSPKQATATGDRDTAEMVRLRWARVRQTKLKPEHRKLTKVWLTALVLVLCIAAFILPFWGESVFQGAWRTTVNSIAFIAFIVGIGSFFLLMFLLATKIDKTSTWALVFPMTLEEYRTHEVSSRRHGQTLLMAGISVLMAALGLVVGLLIKK